MTPARPTDMPETPSPAVVTRTLGDPRFHTDAEIGAVWRKRSGGDEPKDYLSVKLEDPTLPDGISLAMFEANDGKEMKLVWSRRSAT